MIVFTVSASNDLDILVCYIQNVYISAPGREKIYTITGREFTSYAWKVMIIVRVLYGLKSPSIQCLSRLYGIYNIGL